LAKLVFGTNHPVTLVEHDDAFWNRAVIVPFLYTVPKHERDPKLLKKLLKERNGIVQKLMFYAQDLYNNDFNFPYCRESERLKCEWAQNSSSFVTQFIETECEFDDKAFTSTRALLEAYREFSGDDGTSENVFSRILHKQIGLRPDRRKVKGVQSRGFVGIRLQEKDNGMYNIEIS